MDVYSCNYPIYHSFENVEGKFIEYEVSIEPSDIQVYAGKITPYNLSESTLKIDLSVICRQYLETFYENLPFQGKIASPVPVNGNYSTIHTFVVKSGSNLEPDPETGEATGGDKKYTVIYDYNPDYKQTFKEIRCLNDLIDNRIDPRQRIHISGYNVLAAKHTYSLSINGVKADEETIAGAQYHLYSIDLKDINPAVGSMITLAQQEDKANQYEGEELTYVVVPPCRNRFALYYVNKYGGFDSLLMSGKAVESWNPTRIDANLYNDRSQRLSFEQKRISTEIDHKWELNTGLLTNENAKKIHHLIYSPKVFIHDLEKDTLTSGLITDTNYAVKNSRYDLVQYTVNIKESQKQLIR